jgi:hypothetical protein
MLNNNCQTASHAEMFKMETFTLARLDSVDRGRQSVAWLLHRPIPCALRVSRVKATITAASVMAIALVLSAGCGDGRAAEASSARMTVMREDAAIASTRALAEPTQAVLPDSGATPGFAPMKASIDASAEEAALLRVYVSPSGDGDECAEARPCAITAAKAKVAALPEAFTKDVVVELADGVYRLTEPLRYSAADSGRGGKTVTWQAGEGARPVVSGAIRVAAWKSYDAENNIWRSRVPAHTRTRQIYINGVRAPVAQGAPPVALSGDQPLGYIAADQSYATWRNPEELEFVFPAGSGAWTEPRCRVSSIVGTKLTMAQPCWNNATNRPRLSAPAVELPSMNGAYGPTVIENAYELMQAGQWYLDTHEAALYFRAPVGFDVEKADFEIPILEQLVVGEGTLDRPVHDIVFRGIEFAYATWLEPSTPIGFAEIQANITITGAVDAPSQGTCNFSMPAGTCPYGAYSRQPGNVVWHAAHRVAFVENVFTHLGAAGLVFEFGSQNNRVEGNIFRDISGIAIELGNTNDPHPSDVGADLREINAHNLIANNLISHIGVEYRGAVAIMLFFTQQSMILNNEIHDVPYTGISSGAVAGHANVPSSPETTTNINAENEISRNVIYRYLSVLNDGGAIYIEGPQFKTAYNSAGEIDSATSYAHGLSVIGNVVYHQGGTGNALYDDIGSQWINWQQNVQWQASSAHGGCLPVGHLTFANNYHSDRVADFGCGQPSDVVFQDNHVIPRRPGVGDLPAEILRKAGLEAPFRHLSTKQVPIVQHANPSQGQAAADTHVLIAGSGFHSGMKVSWGDIEAVSVAVLSSNFLSAIAPQGAELSLLRVKTDGGSVRMRVNDTDPAIEYLGSWTTGTYWGNYDDDTQHVAEANGDAFSYRFEGTGIDFVSAFDTNRGDVEVYLDDSLIQTASCLGPRYASQQVCAGVDGLMRGVHELRVVKKSGQFLSLDALQIRD